jgi:ABC-type thiamin/hydroxymethylpyrimidine transport system permease subunit
VAAIGGSILGLKFGVGATLLGSVAGAISFSTAATRLKSHSYAPYLACAFGLGIVAFAFFAT